MGYQNLKELGLSDKQAKVLHALIRINEGKASEIAEASGISRVRVYDILKKLYSMGLIRKIEARPTRFKALSPEKTIDKYLKFRKEEFEQERERIKENEPEIKKTLSEAYNKKEKEKPENILELMPLGQVSEKETRDILKEAETVKIISESLSYIDSIEDELKRSSLEVKAILKEKSSLQERGKKAYDKAKEILEQAGAEIKETDQMPLRGTISKKQAIINIKDKESSNLLRDCIHTNHESFVKAMNIYFNNIWDKL